MSVRKLLFLLSFVALPGALWAIGVRPALKERSTYLQQQKGAEQTRLSNEAKIYQAAELSKEWEKFGNLAETALQDLEDHLNPALLQKRVVTWGDQHDCTVRIQKEVQEDVSKKKGKKKSTVVWYSLQAEGDYANLVKFIDSLERGDFRIRFQEIMLTMPTEKEQKEDEGRVVANAIFTIPKVPEKAPVSLSPTAEKAAPEAADLPQENS